MSLRPVAICVPARDEAERLPALVASLSAQRGLGPGVPLRLVIVANNCTDETVPVLRALERAADNATIAFAIREITLPPAEAHVGTARRLAMDEGAAWFDRDGLADGVLLTTDADAVAPPDWVVANLRALDHAEIVGGRLRIAEDEAGAGGAPDGLAHRIDRYWADVRALEEALDPPGHDPMPRHGDHTGASLALSVATYRQVGGLPPLPCGEDNALVARVRFLGGRVRHAPDVAITVSARTVGRVEGGMASEMRRRADLPAGGCYALPGASHWHALFARRAALRRAWLAASAGHHIAWDGLGLSEDDLAAIAPEDCVNDIAFVERAMLRPSQAGEPAREVDIVTALVEIAALLRTLPASPIRP